MTSGGLGDWGMWEVVVYLHFGWFEDGIARNCRLVSMIVTERQDKLVQNLEF